MNTIISTPRRTLIAGAILGALAFSFATVSRAAEDTMPPQELVKFADLDVSTSQGASALYDRIRRAAINVCSRSYDSGLAYWLEKDACLRKAIGDAVVTLNRPALSAVYASKYHTSQPAVLVAEKAR